MADILISKSRGKKYLGGSAPMVPSFIIGDDPVPLNPPGSGNTPVLAFTQLTDTQPSYTGQASKVVSVKADESGLEFTTGGGGGGTDPDAVHYNVADLRTPTEQEQARININSVEQPHMTQAVTGTQIDDLVRTSKFIVFTGTTATSITGMDAGREGDIVNVYCAVTNGISFLSNNVASISSNRFDFNATILSGLSATFMYYNTRWRLFSSGLFINKANADVNYESTIWDGSAAGTRTVRIRLNGSADTAYFNAAGQLVFTAGTCSGAISHARSNSSTSSIRRDEKFLNTSESVVTAGAINNQAITAGIFNQRFTLATSITGHGNGENGRELTINNANTVSCDLIYESASSSAANRYYFATLANLTIPSRGIVTLIYNSTVSRWELKSKNF